MFAFFAYYVNLDIYFTQNNPLFQAKIQKKSRNKLQNNYNLQFVHFLIQIYKNCLLSIYCAWLFFNLNIFEFYAKLSEFF